MSTRQLRESIFSLFMVSICTIAYGSPNSIDNVERVIKENLSQYFLGVIWPMKEQMGFSADTKIEDITAGAPFIINTISNSHIINYSKSHDRKALFSELTASEWYSVISAKSIPIGLIQICQLPRGLGICGFGQDADIEAIAYTSKEYPKSEFFRWIENSELYISINSANLKNLTPIRDIYSTEKSSKVKYRFSENMNKTMSDILKKVHK